MTHADIGLGRVRVAAFPSIIHFIIRSIQRFGRWMKQRNDIEHLQSMPDHMLKDIGLHRSQIISAVVHGKAGLRGSRY